MDIESFKFEYIKIVAIIVPVITVWINFWTFSSRLKKDNIELLKSVLDGRIDWHKRENRLIIEETFESVYKKPLSFDEIQILVLSENPKEAIFNYLKIRSILKISENKQFFEYKKYPKKKISIFSKNYEFPFKLVISSAFYLLSIILGMFVLNHFGTGTSTHNLIIRLFVFFTWIKALIIFFNGLKFNFAVQPLKELLKDKIKTPYET